MSSDKLLCVSEKVINRKYDLLIQQAWYIEAMT